MSNITKPKYTCHSCGKVWWGSLNYCPCCGAANADRNMDWLAIPTAVQLANLAAEVGPTSGKGWQDTAAANAFTLWQACNALLRSKMGL